MLYRKKRKTKGKRQKVKENGDRGQKTKEIPKKRQRKRKEGKYDKILYRKKRNTKGRRQKVQENGDRERKLKEYQRRDRK